MKRKLSIALAITLASLVPGLFLLYMAAAQDQVPGFPIIYSGSVTIAGEPAPDGLKISARLGDTEFGPVTTANGKYQGLSIQGTSEDNTKAISFYLTRIVKADQEDVFTFYGSPPLDLQDAFRTLDLTFAFMPVPTPTATVIPTITPTPGPTSTPSPLPPLAVSLQPPEGDTLQLGDEFILEVVITPEGHRILRGEVAVTFDPRVVKPLDGFTGPVMPQASSVAEIESSLIKVVFFQVSPTSPLHATGPLAVLQFKVRNDATAETAELTLLQPTIVDHLNQPLELALQTTSLALSLRGVPGDINRDGGVNILDLAILGASHGSEEGEPHYEGNADLNQDGKVGPLDVLILAAHYGEEA